jgi:branched-chain amino acid transport system ATP-binding protein
VTTDDGFLRVEGLHVGYDGKDVLHGVSLALGRTAAHCVIGPNGAGKTTLMNCMAGLLRPSAGRVLLDGMEITTLSPFQRVDLGLVLVPEGRRIFAPLTVRENLEMGAFRRLWPRRRGPLGPDFDRVLQMFPRLGERANQQAGTLSGGEQQMLAIGRALMAKPRVLLLDEPSMGLAPLVVQDIFRSLRVLAAEGLPVLLAEQNARMALKLAERGSVLTEGRIVRDDTSAALLADSAVQEAYLGL